MLSHKLKLFLDDLSCAQELPDHDYLFTLSDAATTTLETEFTEYRVANEYAGLGGLIDFTSKKSEQLPLIVVPDLHARAYFLHNILNYVLPQGFVSGSENLTVFQAVEQKKIRIVFVGDLLHSELRCRDRWMAALMEFTEGTFNGPAMTEEMKEGLTLLSMLMELKTAFPENVHILKGNHENIMNERTPGNYPFRKFANEGEMVKEFMASVYGDDVLMIISCFERALPLLAAFPDCMISHAEPKRAFTRQEVINGMNNDEVICGLTWTENNAAQGDSAGRMLDDFTSGRKSLYFGGHRPIQGNYALRQNGKYVQLHNPDRQNIALVYIGRQFDLEKDIVQVGE